MCLFIVWIGLRAVVAWVFGWCLCLLVICVLGFGIGLMKDGFGDLVWLVFTLELVCWCFGLFSCGGLSWLVCFVWVSMLLVWILLYMWANLWWNAILGVLIASWVCIVVFVFVFICLLLLFVYCWFALLLFVVYWFWWFVFWFGLFSCVSWFDFALVLLTYCVCVLLWIVFGVCDVWLCLLICGLFWWFCLRVFVVCCFRFDVDWSEQCYWFD